MAPNGSAPKCKSSDSSAYPPVAVFEISPLRKASANSSIVTRPAVPKKRYRDKSTLSKSTTTMLISPTIKKLLTITGFK